MQDYLVASGIDDDLVAGLRAPIEIAQPNHGGNAYAARENGRVRSPAAGISRQRPSMFQIQLRDSRR